MFLSSGEGRETLALLGPLEIANLNHRTIQNGVSFLTLEDGNIQFLKHCVFF
jgi:hypothetical protein